MTSCLLRGIVVNLCLVFSSSLIYAQDNQLFNLIQKVADGTQQMAKGIIHETGRVLQPDQTRTVAKPVMNKKTALHEKKHSSKKSQLVKKQQPSKTTLAQQTNDSSQTPPTTNDSNASPAPSNGDASSTPAPSNGDASTTPAPSSSDTGSLPTTQSQNGDSASAPSGTTNIPDVAEPGQSGSIDAPNDNQLPEPPQSNDTTTGITGGDAY